MKIFKTKAQQQKIMKQNKWFLKVSKTCICIVKTVKNTQLIQLTQITSSDFKK